MIEFRILGELEVRVDGLPVDIGPTRLRALLAILLIDVNIVVSADQIVSRVWGDPPPSKARETVSSYVYRLRRRLSGVPGVAIETRPSGYVLVADPKTVDLHRFRTLVAEARSAGDRSLALYDEAFELWRGDALANLDTTWLTSVQDRLHAERFAAELDRVDLRLAHGHHAELVADLTMTAADRPFDERVAAQLMLALYRAGRPADALEHYRHTHQDLVGQVGTDPGRELRELHQRILVADPTLFLPTPGPANATNRVPRQLPAPPHLFVGRVAELAGLTSEWLARTAGSTLVISAVSGLGGIGKTWFALRWAHDMVDRFPDGQLFVNLRGYDPAAPPMAPAAAVRGFLDALGVPASDIPVEPDAQLGLYRSLLVDRRMLIVLDNARDAAQVVPLLPGSPTCTVLVTSRGQLYGLVSTHGARSLDLDILGETEARELFDRLVGPARTLAEPAAAEELLAACGGLPLAIGILAARATSHPDYSLTELAGEVRDPARRLDGFDTGDMTADLRAVFACSCRVLDDATETVFSLLGLAPGPDIGLPAVAALAALPLADARRLMWRLTSAHLVAQPSPGRYRMHDLTRRYAIEQAGRDLPPDARDAALRRLVDFYLHTAYAGERALFPQRPPLDLDEPAAGCVPQDLGDLDTAMAWFDAEYLCVQAAHQLAVTAGWHRTTMAFARALDGFRYRRGLVDDNLAGWHTAIDAAQQLGDPDAEARARRVLGVAYTRVFRHTDAIAHLRAALALDESTGNEMNQGTSHYNLSLAMSAQGDHAGALEHHLHAHKIYQAQDLHAMAADALAGIAWSYANLGRFDEAVDYCERARAAYRELGDSPSEATVLDTLGYVHHQTGDHAEAVRCFRHSLELFRAVDNTYEAADTLVNLAEPLLAMGDRAQARATLHQALELYRAQGRTTEADQVTERLSRADISG